MGCLQLKVLTACKKEGPRKNASWNGTKEKRKVNVKNDADGEMLGTHTAKKKKKGEPKYLFFRYLKGFFQ